MKISVIMPFYNSAPWIKRCIDSMKQNPGNFEFILVDDHSTDESRNIAEKCTADDERFVLLENDRSKGVGGARNTGINYTNGDYITFIDSDDEIAPKVWRVYKKAVDSSAGNIIQFNHVRHYRSGVKKIKYANRAGSYSMDKGLPQTWEFVTNKLYSMALIKDIRFAEDMQWGEDELFNIECISENGGFIVCNEAINFIHHFDNLKSLTKTTTAEMLLKQAHVLEEYILKQKNPIVKRFVCYWLGAHWQSRKYMDILGGKK